MLNKRRMLMCAPLALVALGAVQAKAKERVIKIEARKFRFAPNVIELKKGEAVVLELTALDFPHGFSLPDFKIRADLVMGKPVRVKLKPEEAGQFGFLCDNFCGSGHEEMSGTLIVKA
ncbi:MULTISPECIES: cupredoxin domain-containing protein [unclassified Duganella]|uniref:cupredoxin domain-containing protein n=1 Tax=unclassified Duganella TaxID=2636909 RepID=UPI000E340B61|nr:MULTISPECIES: cupredoxin domain-containing protein [unclassified Duganella]RFP13701.1 cytochrome c oxidase subunit II [Duganella sp. BJB475]RFP36409.1 cytochrome c oxidase subunit II [Duganella sp. BJB476]